mmetsp:Transcript_118851/g.296427  ORF Transcript_118851/g.296427 Transcript_118851/m.296427 type:complete len:136 (+) Transcript_118851:1465-1872(+)
MLDPFLSSGSEKRPSCRISLPQNIVADEQVLPLPIGLMPPIGLMGLALDRELWRPERLLPTASGANVPVALPKAVWLITELRFATSAAMGPSPRERAQRAREKHTKQQKNKKKRERAAPNPEGRSEFSAEVGGLH